MRRGCVLTQRRAVGPTGCPDLLPVFCSRRRVRSTARRPASASASSGSLPSPGSSSPSSLSSLVGWGCAVQCRAGACGRFSTGAHQVVVWTCMNSTACPARHAVSYPVCSLRLPTAACSHRLHIQPVWPGSRPVPPGGVAGRGEALGWVAAELSRRPELEGAPRARFSGSVLTWQVPLANPMRQLGWAQPSASHAVHFITIAAELAHICGRGRRRGCRRPPVPPHDPLGAPREALGARPCSPWLLVG